MNTERPAAGGQGFLSFPAGLGDAPANPLTVTAVGADLTVSDPAGSSYHLRCEDREGLPHLTVTGDIPLVALLAACEAVFARPDSSARLILAPTGLKGLVSLLQVRGLAFEDGAGWRIEADLLMQARDLWLGDRRPCFPLRYRLSEGKRHPLRPAKPTGVVYRRFIPWLGQTLSFRAASLEADLPLVHCWMNEPQVAAFWNEDGDLDHHRRYLSTLLADPHMIPLIAALDDQPFGYFEIYWAKENRIAPFYDADDYDRGWHVLIGEPAFRGRPFISAWLPSLMHYLFLDEPRTQRIVGEPAVRHHQQIRNLEKSGFATVKHFDFPHKRAALVMLLRERFFDDRLWRPAAADPVAQPALHGQAA